MQIQETKPGQNDKFQARFKPRPKPFSLELKKHDNDESSPSSSAQTNLSNVFSPDSDLNQKKGAKTNTSPTTACTYQHQLQTTYAAKHLHEHNALSVELEKQDENKLNSNSLVQINLPNIFTPDLNTNQTQDDNLIAPPLSSVQHQVQLQTPLAIKIAKDCFLTEFSHESRVLGGIIEVNLEQIGSHTIHYHLNASPFNANLLQALLPSLMQNLQQNLPKQSHHVHDISITPKSKKKKLIAQSKRINYCTDKQYL